MPERTTAINDTLTREPSTTRLTFQVAEPHEIAKIKREVREAFFSSDEAIIDAPFEEHENGASTTILGYEARRLVGIVTIRWHCRYPSFRDRQIPLIQNIEIQ